ncbi:hypothetical protein PQQ63_15140 [Paraburkholderia metrosideri]|uniref:Uncharacterized protein n=1 Tax=Paraburkholderia metrosideri TaxID=580937 RepID=A0ABW9DRR2_9BURK
MSEDTMTPNHIKQLATASGLDFETMDAELLAFANALLSASKPAAPADHSQCCDTPAFCSSVRRCTAKDAPAPAQSGEPVAQYQVRRKAQCEADRRARFRWLNADPEEVEDFIARDELEVRKLYEYPGAPQSVAQTERALTEEQIDDLQEAREILENMIRSVELDGNYSTEATCTFLRQALQCLLAAQPASGDQK